MVQETLGQYHKQPDKKSPKIVRKEMLMDLYQEAARHTKFEVKREEFNHDLILSKLKKYIR